METANTKALFIIINAGFSAQVVEIAREAGAKGATIIHARGSGKHQASFMGMTVDSEREIVLSLVSETSVKPIMEAIKEKAGRDTPANSICFTMPVERSTTIDYDYTK